MQSPVSAQPPAPSPSDNRATQQGGVALIVVITALFGVFGIIPAAVGADRARREGGNGRRQWRAFGMTFAVQLTVIALAVGATLIVVNVFSSNTHREQLAVTAGTAPTAFGDFTLKDDSATAVQYLEKTSGDFPSYLVWRGSYVWDSDRFGDLIDLAAYREGTPNLALEPIDRATCLPNSVTCSIPWRDGYIQSTVMMGDTASAEDQAAVLELLEAVGSSLH